MGITKLKKISKSDEQRIINIIRSWPLGSRLTWELLRVRVAKDFDFHIDEMWSRQALSANVRVRDAILALKQRKAKRTPNGTHVRTESEVSRVLELETELLELKQRYDRLLLRHTELARNASFLDGGTQLLDPLPDNTTTQR